MDFRAFYIEKVSKLCEERDITIKTLGDSLEMNEEITDLLEHPDKPIKLKMIFAIAEYFNIPCSYFFEGLK